MMEQAWVAEVSEERLTSWLKPPRRDAPFAILERIDCIAFPSSNEEIQVKEWTRGRIFGGAFELRWERKRSEYWVRVIGEREPETGLAPWTGLRDAEAVDTRCFCWGKDEVRIGRQMDYRCAGTGSGRLYVIRREYRSRTGALVADRLVTMSWESAT
jgi:hypothetical protein